MPFLANADVILSPLPARPSRKRNCIATPLADEIIFVHHGQGTLHTMFGLLPFKPFDYVVIPRCTTYRLEFDAGTQPDLLVIESTRQRRHSAALSQSRTARFALGAPY